MFAGWTIKINHTMLRTLKDKSRPQQTEFFLALGTDGHLNRKGCEISDAHTGG
jgi:hypothetical protein